MNHETKIGHREALTLLVFIMSGKVFLQYPRDMVWLGDAAGWIIVILTGILGLVGFSFIYALIRRFPSQNIIEIYRTLTGKFIGTGAGILFFLFFLITTSLFLRKFAETFILAILPETPISVITGFFLILLMYSVFLGIETLTRTAWLYGPYLLGTLIIILIFSLPNGSPLSLTPVLGKGPGTLLKNSLTHVSMFSEILLLGLIAPLIRDKKKVFGVGFYSMVIAIIINTLVTLVVIFVFNYAGASRIIFPIFQLTRLITYGEFIQRAESIFVFLWFFAAGIELGGLFYGTVVGFAETFRIRNYRPLIIPIAIICFSISLIPPSMTDTVNLNDEILSRIYWIVSFGIPFLVWLVALIFNKKEQQTE